MLDFLAKAVSFPGKLLPLKCLLAFRLWVGLAYSLFDRIDGPVPSPWRTPRHDWHRGKAVGGGALDDFPANGNVNQGIMFLIP